MKLNCVYILFIFHDDRYSTAQPRDLAGNQEIPWIHYLPKAFSNWSQCVSLKGTRTILKLSWFHNLVNQWYGFQKKFLYALKKCFFVCVNIVYSLNINIIPKISTADGKSNLKHGHFGYQEDGSKWCVKEFRLRPLLLVMLNWHKDPKAC